MSSANKKVKKGFHRRQFLKAAGLLGAPVFLTAAMPENASPAVPKSRIPHTVVPLKNIGIEHIQVNGQIGSLIQKTVHNNLLVIDTEHFLEPFRSKKLKGEGYSDYIGLGKLIDATVRLAVYTKDEKVLQLKQKLLNQTIATQLADGYIGVMMEPSRMWKLWDLHEMGYIIMGLTSDYRFFGSKKSLTAAQKLADYVLERWHSKPADWKNWAHLGIEHNVLQLYMATKEQRYLDFVEKQMALSSWQIDLDLNTIGKTHMYTDLDLCLAQLDLYSIREHKNLQSSAREAADFLFNKNGAVITGAAGLWESWNNDQGGRKYLGETCATAYQIRLMDRLLRLDGDAVYGDLMERMIYNALMAAQSPDGRQLRYFTPMEGERVYFKPDTYCCPNNFRRIVAELPEMIFYRSGNGLVVNLYTDAAATVQLEDNRNIRIKQQTSYPASGDVVIDVDPSATTNFSLLLRIPSWCTNAVVQINAQRVTQQIVPGKFLELKREWKQGDKVTLSMPMEFRLVSGRVRQTGRVAVVRGPQVFCLDPTQHKQLAALDAADLTNFIIDPQSLELVVNDNNLPGGVSCNIKMADRLLTIGKPLQVKLTAFPDPNGRVLYFRVPDLAVAKPDELLKGANH